MRGRREGDGERREVEEGGRGGRERKEREEGEKDLAGGSEDGCRLGEQLIITRLQLNGLDQHRIPRILVRPQY